MSAIPMSEGSPRTVVLESRKGQVVRVDSKSDEEFLKLADKFVLEAREVAKDPRRRKPRLRWW